MRWLSWLGFGTHLFVLTLACWAAAWQPRVIWIAWAIILLPMNVVAVALTVSRSGRERSYEQALADMRAAP